MKKLLLFSGFIIISQLIFSQSHWETIVQGNDTWKYLPATSEPPSNWNQTGFDDSSWSSGNGGFGYGDGDDATVIPTVNSVYLRKQFTIKDITKIERLLLDIDYDDAFVMFLNGKEVARSNNLIANPVVYNSSLTTDHEALIYQGQAPERFDLKTSSLVQGTNTLAVQVLNISTTSSDMSALVYLEGIINSSVISYHVVPTWFEIPPNPEFSTLPLVYINTLGQTIVSDPKITARMTVINNTNGINYTNDTTYEYNGYIGIDIRGSSSQMFDKKNYNVETRTETGDNNNVSLMGLPNENDWVFHGPYSDKSLMRNALAYYMGNLTGRWSPRTRFCEVYINNEYRGVYVLIEKIKIDKNRVDLAKLKETDISGDELTGGYILKIDRPDPGYWISPYKARNDIQNVPISYVDPKYEDLTTEQRTYIKDYVTNFEIALRASTYKDPVLGYRPYVNFESLVDYYIVNEIARNLDAYRLSTYFYKDKDSKGGKITMGPFWDYNISFGNANFFSAGNTSGWVVDGLGNGDEYGIPFWWDKFRLDPYFNSALKTRWNELRSDKFSNEKITAFIDSCVTVLATPQQRNFQKFNILNTYIWPNNYVGGSYSNEVYYLKNWMNNRLAWIDSQIKLISAVENPTYAGKLQVLAYPNPFVDKLTIGFDLPESADIEIEIQDVLGKIISIRKLNCNAGINKFYYNADELKNGNNLMIYKVSVNGNLLYAGKLIKE